MYNLKHVSYTPCLFIAIKKFTILKNNSKIMAFSVENADNMYIE